MPREPRPRERMTLEQLRTELGLSREKVAGELDVSLSTIANLEKGKYSPHMWLAQALADLYDVGLDDIAWPMGTGKPKKRGTGKGEEAG